MEEEEKGYCGWIKVNSAWVPGAALNHRMLCRAEDRSVLKDKEKTPPHCATVSTAEGPRPQSGFLQALQRHLFLEGPLFWFPFSRFSPNSKHTFLQ